jgi:class 3 adenylate cyclase/tetratricopeptide (TPR) repeat protein
MEAVARAPVLLRAPKPGERLGGKDGRRFEILAKLGGGAMGQVFRAWDAELQRVVALKFLLPRLPLDQEQMVSLLRQEARAVAQLAHENIVRLFDVAEWNGKSWEPLIPFLIMECLEGESLSDVLRREPRLELGRALRLLEEVAAGLEHAHEHHVIHRDLKPSNIFLTRQGQVQLLDFGLAWLMSDSLLPTPHLPTAGTPVYMAPEQWRGEGQDARTDLWAAGILLYELLTGVPPYSCASLKELEEQILSGEPIPSVRVHRPELPPEVESLLAMALAKEPARRFQTARELREEVRELAEHLGLHEQAPGPAVSEYRQVTLVACRLTGLAHLSRALDAEDVSELQEAFHQCCAQHVQQQGGSLVMNLGGEVLACFGYPLAREEDSEHAVSVGLSLVSTVPGALHDKLPHLPSGELGVRVGIHTDKVTLSEPPRDGRNRGLVVQGTAPQVATWMAGLAEPHTVLLSEATHTLVHRAFETRALGTSAFESLSGTVRLHLHQVLRERPARFRFDKARTSGRLTPLVGREQELHRLLGFWEQAREGQGAFVLVSAEAGVGKSRLLQELRGQVSQTSCFHFRSQCWAQSSTSAFQPIIALLRHLFLRLSAAQGAQPLQVAQEGFGLSPEDTALLALLLSWPVPEGLPHPRLSPERQKERTFEALVEMLLHVARQQPVLGVVEDVHWADPSTLELLGAVLERVRHERVLLVLNTRPDFRPAWRSRPWLHRLALDRLSPEHTTALVRQVAGSRQLPASTLQQLVARTDGIPLFIEEMTHGVLEGGTTATIPLTLHELLLARLDRLPSRQKALAQLCAVVGSSFSHQLLTTLTRQGPATLHRHLEGLVTAGLLQLREAEDPPHYQFRHALLRDAAWQSLPRGARRQLHQRIAQALVEHFPDVAETQPERIAHHYTQADAHASAIPYWTRAGQLATQRSANLEAVEHLRQALHLLRLLPEEPRRARQELQLLIALGTPLSQVQGYYSPEVEHTYDRARELIQQVGEDLPQLGLSYWGFFAYYFSRAEYPRANELAEQLVTQGRLHHDRELLSLGHRMMAAICFMWGHMAKALEHTEQALACSDFSLEEHQDIARRQWINPRATALAFGAMVHSVMGQDEEARDSSRQALDLAWRIGHPHTSASVLAYLAAACQLRGEAREALEWSEATLALAREHGFRAWHVWSQRIRLWALAELGQVREVLELLPAMESRDAPAIRAGMNHNDRGLLAAVHLKLGHPREALAMTTEALEGLTRARERFYEAELYRLRGEALRALGHEQEALACFLQALKVARAQGAHAFERRALECLGLTPGDPPDAPAGAS